MARVLDGIANPGDLRALGADDLATLASEIRDLLVNTVARTSGHLGPNLGVVELTIALHRVFDSPTEPILFDVGHQAYVHKILTGRADADADVAPGRRAVGLPEPGREPARLDRELARLHRAVLRRRLGQGLRGARRAPAGGGRRR